MEPEIKTLKENFFVGNRISMSLANNKTHQLWRNFMPRRMEISNAVGSELYSIEQYPEFFFDQFDPDKTFEKWAAVEVEDFQSVPMGMETFTSSKGLYAVFIHRGLASNGPVTYQYIFGTWLPNSTYIVDNRAHFAIMGEKYKQDDPNSEEEL